MTVETRETDDTRSTRAPRAAPGVVLVSSMGRPTLVPLRLDAESVIGRPSFAGALEGDDRVSRRHVRVTPSLAVEDLGSRNGTAVNGARVQRRQCVPGDVIRIGHSLLLLVGDVTPFEAPAPMEVEGAIVGPSSRRAWDAILAAGRADGGLLLLGESGCGKEVAARAFHRATGRSGSLVAVNCAAIPAALAERLLFGTRKGAYSGADADAEGYVQAASGGTLFLDEIAELDAQVQAKLLRVVETKEVLALGAAKARAVDVRVCAATHEDLRARVADKGFRQDLYYRIGRPEVRLPPLRERKEEIPWLIEHATRGAGGRVHVSFVEACMCREWPGNIRELLSETRRAADLARAAGAADVGRQHLDAAAGAPLRTSAPAARSASPIATPDDAAIARALEAAGGNVTRAARELGMHRTQLRRWLEKNRGA